MDSESAWEWMRRVGWRIGGGSGAEGWYQESGGEDGRECGEERSNACRLV